MDESAIFWSVTLAAQAGLVLLLLLFWAKRHYWSVLLCGSLLWAYAVYRACDTENFTFFELSCRDQAVTQSAVFTVLQLLSAVLLPLSGLALLPLLYVCGVGWSFWLLLPLAALELALALLQWETLSCCVAQPRLARWRAVGHWFDAAILAAASGFLVSAALWALSTDADFAAVSPRAAPWGQLLAWGGVAALLWAVLIWRLRPPEYASLAQA